jgi:hypothetical protein
MTRNHRQRLGISLTTLVGAFVLPPIALLFSIALVRQSHAACGRAARTYWALLVTAAIGTVLLCAGLLGYLVVVPWLSFFFFASAALALVLMLRGRDPRIREPTELA